jgi:hypothetical protein
MKDMIIYYVNERAFRPDTVQVEEQAVPEAG